MEAPTIPIPFGRLLKVVAIVDRENEQTKGLLDLIAAEGFELEVSDRYDRDVFEYASVGAYIVSIDGKRLEPARALARAIRATGNRTPRSPSTAFRASAKRCRASTRRSWTAGSSSIRTWFASEQRGE